MFISACLLKKGGGYFKVNSPCFPAKRGIKAEQKSTGRGLFFHQQTSVGSNFEITSNCRDREWDSTLSQILASLCKEIGIMGLHPI